MVDFAKLLAESRDPDRVRSGTLVTGPWPKQGVAFRVRRGSFRVPKAVHANEAEWSRTLGMRLPPSDMGKLVLTVQPEGNEVIVRWRIIRVVAA